MEKRKFAVVDIESAGGLDNPLSYDIGFKIIDNTKKEYSALSLVIYDIYKQKDLMNSAYYADKLPKYEIKLKSGERKMVT